MRGLPDQNSVRRAPGLRSGPKSSVIMALAVLTILGLSVPGGAAPTQFPDILAGQNLILNKGCTNCHGILDPGGRQGPDLFRAAQGKGAADVLAAMWNHIPQMTEALLAGERLPSLSGGELHDLVGYLSYLNFLGESGEAERGGVELASKQCLACHGLRRRGKIGPALVNGSRSESSIGLATDIWNHYPGMRTALRERGLPWFQWSGGFLTDGARYLSGLAIREDPAPLLAPPDPIEGRRLFSGLGCASCHRPAQTREWRILIRGGNRRSAAESAALLLRHLPTVDGGAARGGATLRVRPLSEQAMADLLGYLSLAGTDLSGGDPASGMTLFAESPCSGCHALPGGKPGIGPDVQDIPTAKDPYEAASMMLRHARDMKIATELKHVPWPRLDADHLLDLYAFLSTPHR